MSSERVAKYLPLTETTYYILLALIEPRHGYAIMQHTAELSAGRIKLGPGTLYGAITKFLKEGIIVPQPGVEDKESDRRKVYILTDLGRQILTAEYDRLQEMVGHGSQYLPLKSPTKEKT